MKRHALAAWVLSAISNLIYMLSPAGDVMLRVRSPSADEGLDVMFVEEQELLTSDTGLV